MIRNCKSTKIKRLQRHRKPRIFRHRCTFLRLPLYSTHTDNMDLRRHRRLTDRTVHATPEGSSAPAYQEHECGNNAE